MKKRYSNMIGIVSVIAMFLLFAGFAFAQEHHWSYEGEEGPENWGEISEEYALCSAGRAQSPIDISGANGLDLSDIAFNYNEAPLAIFNNGHTIQVNYEAGSSITYNEITYNLLQFHFHHPSEHTIDGEPAAMELHLVHQSASGSLAVVGVMIVVGEEDNANYATVFDNLPAEESEPAEGTDLTVSAADLLPESATFYTYNGSLTTPPCSEIVRWLVLTEPVVLSEAQIEAFASIFEMNARPVQPLNSRDLLVDSE